MEYPRIKVEEWDGDTRRNVICWYFAYRTPNGAVLWKTDDPNIVVVFTHGMRGYARKGTWLYEFLRANTPSIDGKYMSDDLLLRAFVRMRDKQYRRRFLYYLRRGNYDMCYIIATAYFL